MHPSWKLLLLFLIIIPSAVRADLPGTWELLLANAGTAVTRFRRPHLTAVTRFNTVVLLRDCYAHSVLFDQITNQVRPWCSSGQFLLDGTLLQTDGKSTEFCDWHELQVAELSEGRWYATNQILPDGSVVVVGGRAANSVEFDPPRPGGAVYYRTDCGGDNK